MTTIDWVLGISLIVLSLGLIITVLAQQGKSHNLSGTIAGGAETFFGKSKATSINKKLSIATTVLSIVFVVVVVAIFIKQDTTDYSDITSFFDTMGAWFKGLFTKGA